MEPSKRVRDGGRPMTWIRPLPRAVTRPISVLILVIWAVQMAALVNRSYLQASVNLAADLARYGSDAQWHGVYYRGAKIGFTVREVVPLDHGFELKEDGQLEMTLLGASTAAKIRTTARVDKAFVLRSFEFSLDPGTGPIEVSARVEARVDGDPASSDVKTWTLFFDVTTSGGTRTEERELTEPPVLPLNMGRVRVEIDPKHRGEHNRPRRVRKPRPDPLGEHAHDAGLVQDAAQHQQAAVPHEHVPGRPLVQHALPAQRVCQKQDADAQQRHQRRRQPGHP